MIPRRWADCRGRELKDFIRKCSRQELGDYSLVRSFEEAMSKKIGVSGAVAVGSGRSGLRMILEYLLRRRHKNNTSRKEIIVPAYTLGALVPLLQSLNLVVVPADIDPHTLNVNARTVSRRIGPHTIAILVLHAFGMPCPVEEIIGLSDKHNIPVIEDCAHSFGAFYRRPEMTMTGSGTWASFTSFECTKTINTYGGGMVFSDDIEMLDYVRTQAVRGRACTDVLCSKARAVYSERRLFRTGLGWPLLFMLSCRTSRNMMERMYRLFQPVPAEDAVYLPVQAALGLKKLKTLKRRLEHRRYLASLYRRHLDLDISVQQEEEGDGPTWYFMVVTLPQPAFSVRRHLLLRGIDAGAENEIADNIAPGLGFDDCTGVGAIEYRMLALPIYDDMDENVVIRVSEALNAIISGREM